MNTILKIGLIFCTLGFLEGSPKKGFGPGDQDWGFIDVRPGCHMFYWLFYVQNPNVTSFYDKPLVIWLQGGPGESSTAIGVFEEVGLIDMYMNERNTSWVRHVNVLFIDNPVGTGFSYVDNDDLLARDSKVVINDLLSFLSSFYKQYPKFEKTPLYIHGEHYAAKTTVQLAQKLSEAIENQNLKINFQGIGLEGPWLFPMDTISTWASVIYYMGYTEHKEFQIMSQHVKEIETTLVQNVSQAYDLFENLLDEIYSETYGINFYNILDNYLIENVYKNHLKGGFKRYWKGLNDDPDDFFNFMNGPVKKALGNIPEKVVNVITDPDIYRLFIHEYLLPTIDILEDVLTNTSLTVLIYGGNLGLISTTSGTDELIIKTKWAQTNEWDSVEKNAWFDKGLLQGFYKLVSNLQLLVVLNSGHPVTTYNPTMGVTALRLLTSCDKIQHT